jgi:hypothetical protein
VPSPAELIQKCRLATSRGAGQNNKAIGHSVFSISPIVGTLKCKAN